MTELRPIQPGEMRKVTELAATDNHFAILPTHVVEKAGNLVGYVSINAFPTVLTWLSPVQVKARDSVLVLRTVESLLRGAGHLGVILPCTKTSPFHRYMRRFGYTPVGDAEINLKLLH